MVKNIFATIGILAVLVLSLGLVSAASLSITDISIPSAVNQDDGAFDITFNLSNTGLETDINWSESVSTEGTISSFSFSDSYINTSESKIITATINFPGSQTGNIAGMIKVGIINGSGSDKNFTFSVPITIPTPTPTPDPFEFCNWNGTTGFTNGTELVIKGFSDEQLDNKDEWEWKPLDEIEIEVDVKNVGNDDEDYVVELVFLDSNDNIVDVAEDDKNLEEEVSIDEGDTETVIFTFEVDGDVDDGNNYYMHIKVYQEGDEDEQCVSIVDADVERIDIVKERHDVLVKKVEGPETVEAGSQAIYEVRVSNLGREDQDLVKVIVSNSELGILMTKEIENLDEGDSEIITFSVDFPEEALEKLYKIRFSTEFDYDEDDDIFDKNSDSGDDILYQVTVLGGENIKPTISASLESDAVAGEELVIIATVINNGADGSYDISVSGYEDWAELVSVSPQSLSLDEDEEGTVTITLIPSGDGVQTFKVNAYSEGESYNQAVSVNIAEDEKGLFKDVSKTVLYSGAGIALLVILIFLTLIVKVSRRSKKVPQF
jgi:hypothetical protein